MKRYLVAAALLIPLLPAPAIAKAAAPAPACTPALSATQALTVAKACGGRVEDESARTEYTQTFIEPTGNQTVEIAAVPQRAKRVDGSWGEIDTTLRRTGDVLAPVAGLSNVRFSAGGSGPFASMTHEGKTFSLAWPYGDLPAPAVEGDTATYAEVLPDVDLVVRATGAAFTHYLIVKSAKAAQDPRVRETRYQVGGDVQLVSTSEGELLAKAGETVVASAGIAQMWDTPAHQSAKQLAVSGLVQADRSYAMVASRVAGRELLLKPDAALLRSGQLPIVIDPPWNPGQNQWAYATNNNTNAPMTDGTIASGDPSPAAPILRSGDDTTGRLNRSFMRFPISTVAGKQIVGASISGRVDHTWKCTSNRPNYFYRTAAIAATPRQSWPGPGLQLLLGNISVYANEAACNDPNRPFEMSTGTLVNDVQAFANSSASSYYVGICACSNTGGSGETNQELWMRYFLNDFRLNIAYNTKPNKPDNLTVDNKSCVAGANRPFIKTTTPTLRAHVTDNDGDSLHTYFAYARWKYRDVPVPGDFNGDGKDDMTVWRPADGTWNTVHTGLLTETWRQWGLNGDIPVTGDFNADNVTDALVWRPSEGNWYLSTTGGTSGLLRQWGVNGDVPLAGDFNADNRDDTLVWRPSTFTWYVWLTNGSNLPSFAWGEPTDIPLVGDINGDNKDDAIVWRPSTGAWWVRHTDGTGVNFRTHGAQGDVPLIGDFNNDGKDDLAYYRPSNHTFSIAYTNGSVTTPRVNSGDVQVVGEYNGDGNDDMMSWTGETGSWRVAYTGGSEATLRTNWGLNTASFVDVGGGSQASVPHNGTGQITTFPLADGGIYTFRSQSSDGHMASDVTHMPGNCEWQVDITPPAVPTVVGDIYKEGPAGCPGGSCGSVGETGRFTFSSSSDTQSFLWGWTDPPTTVLNPGTLGGSVSIDFTPASSGPRTLFVRAIDRAGNEANKSYQFYVAAESNAVARWLLNEFTGSAQFTDDTGNGWTASAIGGVTAGAPGRIAPGNDGVSRTSLSFDGVDDRTETTGPVIADTSKSFSVSAWVKITDTTTNRTIMNQLGTSGGNAFWLEYSGTKWQLTMNTADSVTAGTWTATSTTTARANVWTHLAATYDSAADTMRLYVNGALEATTTGAVAWDGNGKFRLGGVNAPWKGSLAEVQVWNRMISANEVFGLYDPLTNALVAKWDMSDVGPGPTYDGSNLVHDLEFYPQPGGPQIPPAGSGHTGTGLSMDGIDDHAITGEPVLYTDQSFTVSAWVFLPTTATGNRSAISQIGNVESGFFLKYEATDGRWYAVYGDVDGTTGTGVVAGSTGAATKGSWVHLVGVYDAQAAQLKLYVNGQQQNVVGVPNPWNATGPMNIGRVQWRGGMFEHWVGSIDEIRVYQGVIADLSRIS